MGDLNGHVGQGTAGYEQVIGHHGVWQRNEEGDSCNPTFLQHIATS